MLGRRSEPRVRNTLRVQISGIDACCEEFSENALAVNLSRAGALACGVHAGLRCGDFITVRYGENIAHFRVIWVLESGIGGSAIAIHRVQHERCPWEEVLHEETVGH
jgi:hypothetical protein